LKNKYLLSNENFENKINELEIETKNLNNNVNKLKEDIVNIELKKQNITEEYEINIKEIKDSNFLVQANFVDEIKIYKKENFNLNNNVIELEEKL